MVSQQDAEIEATVIRVVEKQEDTTSPFLDKYEKLKPVFMWKEIKMSHCGSSSAQRLHSREHILYLTKA